MFSRIKEMFSAPNINLKEIIKSGAILLDVRSPQEFAAEKIPTAINIPVDQLESKLDKLLKDDTIVVFCMSGGRSGRAVALLKKNGFTKVYDGRTYSNVRALMH